MLDALLLLSTVAFIAAGGVVGWRLLRLAQRTRQLTDFIVGFMLFDLSAVAYPLVLWGGLGNLPIERARWVYIAGAFAMAIGWAGVFVFTVRVFRPGVAWARGLAAFGIALLAYGFVAGARFDLQASDASAFTSPQNPVFWQQGAAILAYGWTGLEGLRCFLQARKRLALGLADPLVVNRFLLWAWSGVFALICIAPSFVIGLSGGDLLRHTGARFATAVAGFAFAIATQLAFLPPAAYRRWVSGGAAVSA